MKKAIVYGLVGVLVLFFSACGGGGSSETSEAATQTTVTTAQTNDIRTVLAGKKLYISGGWIEFDAQMTTMTGMEDGILYVYDIEKIEDNKIYIITDEEGTYYYVASVTDKYVELIPGQDGLGLEDVSYRAYFHKNDMP